MSEEKKRSLIQKLTDKYRLLIIDEDTFEHKLDMSLNRLNVFVISGLIAMLLISGTFILIANTPLKEYIPGYPKTSLKKEIYQLAEKNDSLRQLVEVQGRYLNQLRMIVSGDINPDSLQIKPGKKIIYHPDSLNLAPSKEDSILRKEVEEKQKFGGLAKTGTGNLFIPPVKGMISRHFNRMKSHLGTDIILKKNTPVKSIADGTVVLSEWSEKNGNIIVIKHPGNFLSVYKHNKKLYKHEGEHVKAGEVIAASGNQGENSTGPHLHFELWYNGQPVNPEDYIDFSP